MLGELADLAGLRVLVTAGGTREPIDSVRFVGNRSSGRMGFALAEQAARRGAAVTVLAANVALPRAPGVSYRRRSRPPPSWPTPAREEFPRCDVLLMAAAVADFRPVVPADDEDQEGRRRAGVDRAGAHARHPRRPRRSSARAGQTVVGFAAEHGDGALDYARDKLARKRLDAIVVNDISRADIGFDTPDNEVTIVTPDARAAAVARAEGRDRRRDPRRGRAVARDRERRWNHWISRRSHGTSVRPRRAPPAAS